MPSKNAHVSYKPSSIRRYLLSARGPWNDRLLSSTTWPRCALAKNAVFESPVHCGKIAPRRARRMMRRLMSISNQSTHSLTRLLGVNFHSDVDLSNVCVASATPHSPCVNDNISSAVSIHCNDTSTGTINFSRARAAHSPTKNVPSLCSKASCTSRIMLQESTESTCLTNASVGHSSIS